MMQVREVSSMSRHAIVRHAMFRHAIARHANKELPMSESGHGRTVSQRRQGLEDGTGTILDTFVFPAVVRLDLLLCLYEACTWIGVLLGQASVAG